MAFKTLSDIRTKMERELDLEAEEFIQPEEMVEYINDAITKAEAHIINLGLRDKYFQKRTRINLVSGQEDYDLPTDIYADKIIKIIYQNEALIYPVKPIASENMYEAIQFVNQFSLGTNTAYRYLIRHDDPGEEKLQIVPRPQESVTNGLTVWHYRDANRLEEDDDVCDLPEIAYQFVYDHVRVKVYEKERGQSWLTAKDDRDRSEKDMVETLQQQIADSDMTLLDQDMTTYEEHN